MSLFNKKQFDIPRRRSVKRDTRPLTSADIFRRNRTLTGTTSNNLGSAGAKSDLESSRTHVHHLAIHRRKILSIMIIVFMSATFLWIIISNLTATVVVSVPSTAISKPIDMSRYEKIIQQYLNANPLSRLKFILDQSAMSDYVSSNLLEVVSVSQQNTTGIGQTNFVVTMRTPVAGWNMNNKQYYVDSKGIAFDINYFLPPSVQIVDNRGIAPQTGAAIVSNRFLSFVGRVVSAAKASGYTVAQATLPPNTTRELYVSLKDSTILIKLSVDRSAGEQIEDMSRALKYFAGHNIVPSYIDVRVSGKAFYK